MSPESEAEPNVREQTIGELLRDIRKESEVTLQEFSRRTGLDVSYVSKVETDKLGPSVRVLEGYISEFGLARFYAYEKAGFIKCDLDGDSLELLQDWFNEGNIVLTLAHEDNS